MRTLAHAGTRARHRYQRIRRPATFVYRLHFQQIAAVGPSGKAIAPRTVVNYILAALKQDKPLDVARFERQCAEIGCASPSETEWKQLLTAFNQSMSRADVPQTHLLNLMSFLPEAAKPRVERTAADGASDGDLVAPEGRVVPGAALCRTAA